MEYLVSKHVDEELANITALQKFCWEVILPKLSVAKREAVLRLIKEGLTIEGAMAQENIKIIVN